VNASSAAFFITPTGGALTATGEAANVVRGNVQTPVAGALAITGTGPVVRAPITPNTGSLQIQGQAPVVRSEPVCVPGTGALTVTGVAPGELLAVFLIPGTGALTATGNATAMDLAIRPPSGSLSIVAAPPNLEQGTGTNTNRSPATGTLALVGFAPTIVTTSTDFGITLNTGALGLQGFAPRMTPSSILTPGTGALIVIGQQSLDMFPRHVLVVNAHATVSTVLEATASSAEARHPRASTQDLINVEGRS
jgi:hypothetical protein